MPRIGGWEWVIVLVIVLLIFGVGRLSKVGRELGEGIRAHGFGRHGNPPFTASSPAGRQALAAVCRQIVDAHKKMRSSPGQVGTWYQTGRPGARVKPRPAQKGGYSAALSSGVTPARS